MSRRDLFPESWPKRVWETSQEDKEALSEENPSGSNKGILHCNNKGLTVK